MIHYFCGQPPLVDDLEFPFLEANDYDCYYWPLAGELKLDEVRVLAAHNYSASAALQDLVRLPVKSYFSCWRGNHTQRTCSLQSSAPRLPPESKQRIKRNSYPQQTELQTHFLDTLDGVWESRIYWGRDYKEVKLCSTLKPKVIMGPGPRKKYRMTFTLQNSDHFNMSSQA
jgi:hypothetical protein